MFVLRGTGLKDTGLVRGPTVEETEKGNVCL